MVTDWYVPQEVHAILLCFHFFLLVLVHQLIEWYYYRIFSLLFGLTLIGTMNFTCHTLCQYDNQSARIQFNLWAHSCNTHRTIIGAATYINASPICVDLPKTELVPFLLES